MPPIRKTLEAHESPLKNVFCDDYTFTIPGYQRPYAWTKENALALVDDILTYLKDQPTDLLAANPYFLGSVVLIKGQDPESEVVDGQQRLTTLTILFSLLRTLRKEVLPEAEEKNTFGNWIFQLGNTDLMTEDKPRLQLREKDRDFFRTHIQAEGQLDTLFSLNGNLSDSQQNIKDNAQTMLNALKDLNKEELQRFCQFLLNGCYLVLVTTPDIDSAYRIFSVMNDRGLDLATTDILKTLITGEIDEARRDRYTKAWEDLEENLGRELFNDLFAHIRMIKLRAKLTGSVLSEYKEKLKPMKTPIEFIEQKLKPYANAYSRILDQSFPDTPEYGSIKKSIFWLNKIDNFDWLPPAIYYLKNHEADADALQIFFKKLERLASIMMVLRYAINSRIYRYKGVLDAIDDGSAFHEGSSLMLTEEEQKAAIRQLNGPLYPITRIRMPVLLRLDSTLHDGTASYNQPTISVEHVMPQTPGNDSQWKEWCPDEEEYQNLVHTIGNLVLLSRSKNSSASNYEFDKKKDAYFFKGVISTPFVLTNEIRTESTWTPEIIKRRQERLISKLATEWELTQ